MVISTNLFAIEKSYDVIVVGLGAMGSAATYQLSKANLNVLGIDMHTTPHAFGSSHGDSRITRLAIGEGAEYTPLALRTQQIFREIEAQTHRKLIIETGGLIMSVAGEQDKHGVTNFLKQTIDVANEYKIQHAELSTSEIKSKYPEFKLTDSEQGYYEAQAGYLIPEECIAAELQLAQQYGAKIHTDERMISFAASDHNVTVVTTKGSYEAKKIILTVGPWVKEVLSEYEGIFKIYRQVQYWYGLRDTKQYSDYHKLPVFIWIYGNNANDFIYGFPAIDGPSGGLKVATEDFTHETSPNAVVRTVSELEKINMYNKIKNLLPGLSSECIKAEACLYTVTPDYKFVIDFLPDHKNVIIASACSGHGFKHSAAIGEILMQLTTTGESSFDISAFRMERFKTN